MNFHILTLFPDFFQSPLDTSILKRAITHGLLGISLYNIRDWATSRHKVVDDVPYGGGCGMVMKPEPLMESIAAVKEKAGPNALTIYLSPEGEPFRHQMVRELGQFSSLILVCGHYEGIDERVRQQVIDREISIGDYILTGGEIAALVIIDAVSRFIDGVLGNPGSAHDDSLCNGILEYPQYTRPEIYRGLQVPDILLSGHHEKIRKWRRFESLRRTWTRRPDLLEKADLTKEDQAMLAKIKENGELYEDSKVR
jgi:tRNA (guanine37-N1)-methyltransferase